MTVLGSSRNFPPQRGERIPLMWGFIPHAVGNFRSVSVCMCSAKLFRIYRIK